MDGTNSAFNKEEHLEDLRRARELYEKAVALLEADLETTVNRIYLSFENLAHGFLKWKYSQVSVKHAQIWERMSKLYLQGILSFDPKMDLILSYQFHLYVDYGRKVFKGEQIHFNKEKVKELLQALRKLLEEVEKIITQSKTSEE